MRRNGVVLVAVWVGVVGFGAWSRAVEWCGARQPREGEALSPLPPLPPSPTLSPLPPSPAGSLMRPQSGFLSQRVVGVWRRGAACGGVGVRPGKGWG